MRRLRFGDATRGFLWLVAAIGLLLLMEAAVWGYI